MPWPKRKRAFLRLKRRGGNFSAWTVLVALIVNILLSAQISDVYAGSAEAPEANSFERDILFLCSLNGSLSSSSSDQADIPEQDERRVTRNFCVFCLPLNGLVMPRTAPIVVLSEGIVLGARLSFLKDAERNPVSLSVRPLGSRAPPSYS